MPLILLALLSCTPEVSDDDTDVVDVPEPGELQVGVSRVRIPIPLGIGTVGNGGFGVESEGSPFAEKYPATKHIHNHPDFRVVVLSRGDGFEQIWLRIDTVGIFQQLRRAVVLRAEERLGKDIDDALIIGATHTHSGPGRMIDAEGPFELIADEFFPQHYDRLVESMVDAIELAYEDLAPGRVGTTVADAEGVMSDRRCEDGLPYVNSSVPLVAVEQEGELAALFLAVPIHGTVIGIGDLHISQDVSGGIENAIEDRFPEGPMVMMFNSWGADMAPGGPEVSTQLGAVVPKEYDRIAEVGQQAADAVDLAWADLTWHDEPEIHSEVHRFPINREAIGYDEQTFLYDYGGVYCASNQQEECPDPGDPDYGEPVGSLEPFLDDGCLPFNESFPAPDQTEVTSGQLANFHVVTFPGEPGTRLAEKVVADLAADGVEDVFFLGYSQDYLGYAILEDDWWLGGYEASGAMWGPQQGEYLSGRVVDVSRAVRDGTDLDDELAPVAAFGERPFDPWEATPAIDPGTVLTDVAGTYGPEDVIELVVLGLDPWETAPIAVLEDTAGNPILRDNGQAVDSDGAAFWIELDPVPAYRDEPDAAEREFRWIFRMAAQRQVVGAVPDLVGGTYQIRVTLPDGTEVVSSSFEIQFVSLDDLRGALDAVDRKLVEALAERFDLVAQVADLKEQSGGLRVRDVERESALLGRVVAAGRELGIDPVLVNRIYQEILDHSVRSQHLKLSSGETTGITVVYQGTRGAYSHLAAQRHFAVHDDVRLRGLSSFRAILEAVAEGRADYAVLPIENTTAGSINEAYDLLAQMDLSLVGEEIQKVDHCLLGLTPEARPLTAWSHPQALKQCSRYLEGQQIGAKLWEDTAGACEKVVADGDPGQAAIASRFAAELYGLHVLATGIANQPENFTRMVVAAREPIEVDDRIPCKTSLVFATRHEEGALLAALNVLASHGLNLTKLESRPRPRTPWEYTFYVDFEGNVGARPVEEALEQLVAHTSYLKVLGSYPIRTSREARPARPAPPLPGVERPLSRPRSEVTRELASKPYAKVSRVHRSEDTVIAAKDCWFGGSYRVVVAGPPAADDAEAARQIASRIQALGGGALLIPRATAEELGEIAKVVQSTGVPLVVECPDTRHLGPLCEVADVLRLAARNMDDLALLDAVGRVDRPVILERGLTATLDDWLRAAERIMEGGNQQVILCDTGIRTFEDATRNTLDLAALPALRERTHLPILVDPLKAAGTWRWALPTTRAALAAGAHGVLLRVLDDPKQPDCLALDRLDDLVGVVSEAPRSAPPS